MSQRTPLTDVLNDKSIAKKRKEQIKQVQSIRKFASNKLKLPKNDSYTSYVDLKRDAISWNVIATPKYSISPIQTCFPVVGCTSYLIYFSQERAKQEAEKHKKQGHDTHIIASPAYSTGGYFDDPIVSTMFKGGTISIAQVVFHELAHQKLFFKNNSALNEAFASTIGEQGTRLWLKEEHPDRVELYNSFTKKRSQFFDLLITTRKSLATLYKTKKSPSEMAQAKKQVFADLDKNYLRLKQTWDGDNRFDNWFKQGSVNNARLAVIGVYYQKVPELTRLLKSFNYDFARFYQHLAKTHNISVNN